MVAIPSCAMVLAAGLGKRMRPLTATRPKPLIEVAGRTLLDHALDRLEEAGVGRAVVNVHYLAGAVEAHLAKRRRGPATVISDERDQLLETGGGVVKALPMIGCDPFLVVNSDTIWVDGPFNSLAMLAERFDPARMDVCLMLVPAPHATCHAGPGDFRVAADGRLSWRRPGTVATHVYAGAHVCAKGLFAGSPDGPFSLVRLWSRAIEAGRAYGFVHPGLWFDVGTPPAIAVTEARLKLD